MRVPEPVRLGQRSRLPKESAFCFPLSCQKRLLTGNQVIQTAEVSNLVKPHTGSCIFEGTSGSTGISIAGLARARGYKARALVSMLYLLKSGAYMIVKDIVLSDDVAKEKVQLLEAYGAEVERGQRSSRSHCSVLTKSWKCAPCLSLTRSITLIWREVEQPSTAPPLLHHQSRTFSFRRRRKREASLRTSSRIWPTCKRTTKGQVRKFGSRRAV